MSDGYVLEMTNINKTFPGVKALDGAYLRVKEGEVVALCGENGAGKSTLMKILSGVYQADKGSGEIRYRGEQVHFSSPVEAKNAGIVLIFQELSLVQELSVAENIYLGSLPKKGFRVDWKKLNDDTKKVLEALECPAKPEDMVASLPIAQQQMVEIARGIALGARILVLDEPTSSLTEREKEALFRSIRNMKAQGVGIIYISHKMDEIFEISDRVMVMRDGRPTGDFATKEITLDDILFSMIGRSMDQYFYRYEGEPGAEVLRVEGLSLKGYFKNISFRVRAGEVVGFYGLVGAGRTEIMETIFGIRKADSGKVFLNGTEQHIRSSGDAVRAGIGFLTENRKEQGLVLGEGCRKNTYLAALPELTKRGFVQEKETHRIYDYYRDKLGIKSPSSEQEVGNLSGGNQQKVVVGKWMAIKPKLLILDEPTRGIDVNAKAEIYKLIASLAEEGIAIILISSEMPEIMGVSNRVITMAQGMLTGELSADEVTEERLMRNIMITDSTKSA
ncbi:MAG: sugar ABC transporter ATP-binding protein [Blautia sp.]|nr:sugar ABC transporter ATP-binding protein [Blautia sp.]